jgi:hypothetical protein
MNTLAYLGWLLPYLQILSQPEKRLQLKDTLAYFAKTLVAYKKSFIALTPGCLYYKTFLRHVHPSLILSGKAAASTSRAPYRTPL